MRVGSRVKLINPGELVKLRSPYGTIVADDTAGYYVIEMDEPASVVQGAFSYELRTLVQHVNELMQAES